MEQLAADQGEEAKMMPNSMIKPLHKIIAEHKDVTKIVIQLNSIITQNKMEAQEVLDIFTKDSHLWDKVDIVHPDQLLGAINPITWCLVREYLSSFGFRGKKSNNILKK